MKLSSSRTETARHLALLLAHEGVRNNTILEDLHVDHHIPDAKMKVFMTEVVDNIYTILTMFLGHDEAVEVSATNMLEGTQRWDEPKLNHAYMDAVRARLSTQSKP